jgi:hypothetical protein
MRSLLKNALSSFFPSNTLQESPKIRGKEYNKIQGIKKKYVNAISKSLSASGFTYTGKSAVFMGSSSEKFHVFFKKCEIKYNIVWIHIHKHDKYDQIRLNDLFMTPSYTCLYDWMPDISYIDNIPAIGSFEPHLIYDQNPIPFAQSQVGWKFFRGIKQANYFNDFAYHVSPEGDDHSTIQDIESIIKIKANHFWDEFSNLEYFIDQIIHNECRWEDEGISWVNNNLGKRNFYAAFAAKKLGDIKRALYFLEESRSCDSWRTFLNRGYFEISDRSTYLKILDHYIAEMRTLQ